MKTKLAEIGKVISWILIIIFTLFVFAIGFYRMYIAEENKYLLNDYLNREVGR